ncbi:MAG TPA: hypothetical protein VHG27_07215 [Xanthobacteraceae bacterium]|nr:hypothetical protein [Xanthobacteraceae bacterium]
MRIFSCQHLTREAVWIPELLKHANTAKRIDRLEILSPDPQGDAQHMARLIDGEIRSVAEGAFVVPSGGERADFSFLSRHALARRHPGVSIDDLPERGPAVLVLAIDDLDAAARATSPHGVQRGEAVYVPPTVANGLCLCFIEA